jgi:hypothetical protein
MSITGSLTDFSLAEISQFMERGHRTGLLTLRTESESPGKPPSVHYLWIERGSLVATANELNCQGLISLIVQYQWSSERVVTKLAQFCPPDKPLGLYLKNQGALQAEQLKHLFQVQVLQQVCPLFQLQDALFNFDQDVPLPILEMTGLSVPAGLLEVTLQKLILLEKLFAARELSPEAREWQSRSNNLCDRIGLILDIAFFHSLKFSLFDPNNSLPKLSQFVDLYYRPYDLPKSRASQAMCCAGR